jgi:hypothetical protein
MALQAHASGAEIIVTGVGGDDILENIVTSDQHFQVGTAMAEGRQAEMPPFLTDKFQREYLSIHKRLVSPPLSSLPVGILVDASHNNSIIEQGMWYASPFASPRFYEYCQGLEAHMRANKNILRAYHQANSYLEDIYNASVNENFSSFMQDSLTSTIYNDFARHRLEVSPLVQAGFVDRAAMLRFIEERSADTDFQHLYHFYTWLCAEINLHSAVQRK